MDITSLTLADILRAQHVTRWHILREYGRTQSVAEHSYNVAMIARAVLQAICSNGLAGITNYEALLPKVLQWALIHDLPEVVLGDTVTITKRQAPEAFAAMEKRVDPNAYDFKSALPEIVIDVVKIADLLDAINHLNGYPHDDQHRAVLPQVESIKQALFASLDKKIKSAEENRPAWAYFPAIRRIQNAVYHGQGTFIDDLFKEEKATDKAFTGSTSANDSTPRDKAIG